MDTLNPSIHLHLQTRLHLCPPSPPLSVYMQKICLPTDFLSGSRTCSLGAALVSPPPSLSGPCSSHHLHLLQLHSLPLQQLLDQFKIKKKKKNHLQVFLIWVLPCFIPRDTNHLIIEAWPGKLLWCQTPKSMPGSAVSCMAHGGCRFCRHTSFFFLLSSNPPPVPLSSLPLSVQFSCSVVSDTL